MSSNSFYPTNEAGKIVWLKNYAAKLPEYGPICGITADEITASLKDITYELWLYEQLQPAKRNDLKAIMIYRDQLLSGSANPNGHPDASNYPPPPPVPEAGIEKRRFSEIARIKASLGYNEEIGRNLSILTTSTSKEHPFPEFTAFEELGAIGFHVRIVFKKHGHEGVYIESRINGGDWVFLAIDTVKPYLDERPLTAGNSHEVREYRMRWWDKSKAHGEWSAIQKVAVGK